MKISDEAESAFTEAFVERINLQVEARSFERDQEEKFRKTARDAFEQENDIVVEFAELQFARNAELLADEKRTQKERHESFKKNQKLSDEVFLNSIGLIIEQASLSIDLNKKLTESQKAEKKAALLKIDFNKILLEQDVQKRAELIRAIDLGEIEEKVLKDTFKLRFDQNNELLEQKKELVESDRENLEIQREIALQEIALELTTNKKLEELSESRFELEKQNLRERIELLKEDSNERLNLEKELNDLLLEEQEKALEKTKKQEQLRHDLIDAFLEAIIKANKVASQKRIDAIDAEIKASETQQDVLRKAAQEGIADTKENLVIAERLEAAARVRKEQEIRKQRRDEAKLVFLKLIANHADAGDKNPFLAATLDFFKTQIFLNSLDSFDKGTDRLGHTDKAVDDKGGRLIIAHKDEAIFTAEDNKAMDYAPNSVVVENYKLAEKMKAGELVNSHKELMVVNHYQSNKEMLDSMNRLENAMKNVPKNMPRYTSQFDKFNGTFKEMMKHGNKTETYTTKIGGGGIMGSE